MKITYYLEVLSSWCHWAEPTWAGLKERYKDRVQFEWRIALMRPEDFPVSRSQCDWFYRRSGGTVMRSPYMLNSGWFEEGRGAFENPSLVAEAGRDFGFSDDTVRLALSTAALRGGRKVGDMGEAVSVAAKASGIPAKKLRASAESNAVRSRVDASTREFFSHQLDQGRPTFVLESAIGDKAVFSGLVRIEPLAATIDAMLSDAAAYASHSAHHGTLPKR
jgi:predicted DsbA family dithiol-disulfide isomerase